MINNDQRITEINKFWFGRVEETIVPSENRARIWFGEDPEVDRVIKDQFLSDMEMAREGKYEIGRAHV